MLEHPIYREIRVMALAHLDEAVERRDQDHPGHRTLCGELHRNTAAQAAAEKKHLVRFELPRGVVILGEPVGAAPPLRRRAFALALAAVGGEQPANASV